MSLARRTGRFVPIVPPDVAAVDPGLATALTLPTNRLVGTPDTVAEQLEFLARDTLADEVMLSTVTFDVSARCRSLQLLAAEWAARDQAAAVI